MKKYFPPVDILFQMEPEAIAPYLLIYLNAHISTLQNKEFHMNHIIHNGNQAILDYSGGYPSSEKVALVLSEAWQFLSNEGFLAPAPSSGMNHGQVVITRRGQEVKTEADFKKFAHLKLLPRDVLDTELSRRIWPSFVDGEFDTAVFAAFKEVEVRMRNAAGLDNTHRGVALAREVFNPDSGQLTDMNNLDKGERVGYMELFSGAIGVFKNPGSHLPVNYDDPVTAVSLILFANTLLKITDKRKP
jgi:uncharacterized protein (TIGR02391 family)